MATTDDHRSGPNAGQLPADACSAGAPYHAQLSAAERANVVAALERCYTAAGLRWRGNVVWVASPLSGALAARALASPAARERRWPSSSSLKLDFSASQRRNMQRSVRSAVDRLDVAARKLLARAAVTLASSIAAGLAGALAGAVLCWLYAKLGLFWMCVTAFVSAVLAANSASKPASGCAAAFNSAVFCFVVAAMIAWRNAVPGLAESVWNAAWIGAGIAGALGAIVGAITPQKPKTPTHQRRFEKVRTELGLPHYDVSTVHGQIGESLHFELARSALRDLGSERVAALRAEWLDIDNPVRAVRVALSTQLDLAAADVIAAGPHQVPSARGSLASWTSAVLADASAAVRRAGNFESADCLTRSIEHESNAFADLELKQGPETTHAHRHFMGQLGVDDFGWLRHAYQRGLLGPNPAGADALEALSAAHAAGAFWPLADCVIVSERPVDLHLERHPDTGRPQLHRIDGPALSFSDGFALYASHGTLVPAEVCERAAPIEIIHAHPTAALRLAAVERLGWERYVRTAQLRRVSSAPDPSCATRELTLYEDPLYRLGVLRVLVMTERNTDGYAATREVAFPVPFHLRDPIEAAATANQTRAAMFHAVFRDA